MLLIGMNLLPFSFGITPQKLYILKYVFCFSWATPAQHLYITKLKPQSTTVDGEYKLKVYERNIQVQLIYSSTTQIQLHSLNLRHGLVLSNYFQLYNLQAYFYPVYLRMISAATPEGVTMNIMEHQPEHDEIRFVPDTELKQLQEELEELGGARKQKKKKK